MALADIINRIGSDGSAESESELSAARERAEQLLERARADAEAHRDYALGMAQRSAASQAATIVATARLAARDQALAVKRELVDEVLSRTVEAIEALPGDRYVRFLAAGIAESARPDDSVALAAADADHLAAVRAAVELAVPELALRWDAEPAPVSRGAIVTGPRTRVEVTPASMVDERRNELELTVATELFSREER